MRDKRSRCLFDDRSDIRKFKRWLDAEYTVIEVDNNRMRLAVDGVFREHDAMANIWIEHKGVKVSVGSGFTAEQRIRFGKHPEEIVSTPSPLGETRGECDIEIIGTDPS